MNGTIMAAKTALTNVRRHLHSVDESRIRALALARSERQMLLPEILRLKDLLGIPTHDQAYEREKLRRLKKLVKSLGLPWALVCAEQIWLMDCCKRDQDQHKKKRAKRQG